MAEEAAALADGLIAISEAVHDELGELPTLDELLEILAYGAATLPEEALGDVAAFGITALPAVPASHRGEAASRIAELNDNAFVLAADLFSRWWQRRQGAAATAAELGDALLAGLKRSEQAIVSDRDPAEIAAVKVVAKKAAKRAKPGDLVAIPSAEGGYHLTLVVARNSRGVAFGLFRGRHPLRPPSSALTALPHPVYSEDRLLGPDGWKIVGHEEQLLASFPAEPEVYHRPDSLVAQRRPIGAFGAAEIHGALRDVTRDEAERVGLLDGTYRQFYGAEELEHLLPTLIIDRERG